MSDEGRLRRLAAWRKRKDESAVQKLRLQESEKQRLADEHDDRWQAITPVRQEVDVVLRQLARAAGLTLAFVGKRILALEEPDPAHSPGLLSRLLPRLFPPKTRWSRTIEIDFDVGVSTSAIVVSSNYSSEQLFKKCLPSLLCDQLGYYIDVHTYEGESSYVSWSGWKAQVQYVLLLEEYSSDRFAGVVEEFITECLGDRGVRIYVKHYGIYKEPEYVRVGNERAPYAALKW